MLWVAVPSSTSSYSEAAAAAGRCGGGGESSSRGLEKGKERPYFHPLPESLLHSFPLAHTAPPEKREREGGDHGFVAKIFPQCVSFCTFLWVGWNVARPDLKIFL